MENAVSNVENAVLANGNLSLMAVGGNIQFKFFAFKCGADDIVNSKAYENTKLNVSPPSNAMLPWTEGKHFN